MATRGGLELSILLVGYNSAKFLDRCLSAIDQAAQGSSFEVLFIDNGTDGSEDLVRKNFPQVHIEESRGNIGFAAANNCLAKKALGRFLLLLNPDTAIAPDAISRLLAAANSEPRFGVLGGTTMLDGDHPGEMAELALPTSRYLLGHLFSAPSRDKAYKDDQAIIEVEATSGGFMLVRKELWDQLGGMDPQFFLYAEDLDFCKRAAGIAKIGEDREARVVHSVGSGTFYSPTRMLYQARGNATFQRKHEKRVRAAINILMIWLGFVVRAFYSAAFALASPRHRLKLKSIARLVFLPWIWMGGYAKN